MTQHEDVAWKMNQLTVVLTLLLPMLERVEEINGKKVIAAPPQEMVRSIRKILATSNKEKKNGKVEL